MNFLVPPSFHSFTLDVFLVCVCCRLAFGYVNHKDAKQTDYALRIVRAHCLDDLSLATEKGWHI
jgi:hypothetical protein